MARRNPSRKVTHFEPVPPRLPRNTVIESTFMAGRRFRCTILRWRRSTAASSKFIGLRGRAAGSRAQTQPAGRSRESPVWIGK